MISIEQVWALVLYKLPGWYPELPAVHPLRRGGVTIVVIRLSYRLFGHLTTQYGGELPLLVIVVLPQVPRERTGP